MRALTNPENKNGIYNPICNKQKFKKRIKLIASEWRKIMERINEMQVANEGVQMLVKMLFETLKQMFPDSREMTEEEFARKFIGKEILGQLKELYGNAYTEAGADFVADAVAKFGGLGSYVSVLKREVNVSSGNF